MSDASTQSEIELRAELQKRSDFMARRGYRECDIAACNCEEWHNPYMSQALDELRDLRAERDALKARHSAYRKVLEETARRLNILLMRGDLWGNPNDPNDHDEEITKAWLGRVEATLSVPLAAPTAEPIRDLAGNQLVASITTDSTLSPFPPIHCECGETWTQEMNTVCPYCFRWPKRALNPETPVWPKPIMLRRNPETGIDESSEDGITWVQERSEEQ